MSARAFKIRRVANYRRIARRAARRYGLDPNIFVRQIQQESGFDPHITSGAGAQGIAQIMPGTARSWGVNPNNPRQALNAAAKNMAGYVKKYGGYENALRAYNAGPGAIKASRGYAETNAYVAKILGGSNPKGLGTPQGAVPGVSGSPGTVGAQNVAMGSTGALEAILALSQPKAAPGGSVPTPPAFSAAPTLPTGYQGVQSGGGKESAGPDITSVIDALKTQGGDVQFAPGMPGTAGAPGLGAVTGGTGSTSGGGRVVVDPNADRAGARTHKYVVDAVRRMSAIAGQPVRIGTGTRHSRMTTTGNVSDHWSGDAADIPATGKRLIRLGQAALIDAGMDPKKARKQTGGLFTLPSGAQVIFNVSGPENGGDHTNHVHYHPARRRR